MKCLCDYQLDKMSMINCCMIICHIPISQNLWFHPWSWVLYECKSNSFPVHLKSIFLVWNLSRSCLNKLNSFCCICGEVLKGKGCHYQNSWERLMNWIFAVRSEIKIKFGCRGFAEAHVQELWQLVERYPQIDAFCCSNGMAWALTLLKRLLFCMTKATGLSQFSKHKMEYPYIHFVLMMIQCQCPSHQNFILLTQIQNRKRRHQICGTQHECRPKLFNMLYFRATSDHLGSNK